MRTSRCSASHHGFTILELMFTIAIASIILAVAVPSFRSMMASGRLVTQANEIVGAVQFARSESITRNATITFCRADAEDETECAGSSDEWEFWMVIDADDEVLARGALPSYGGTLLIGSELPTDEVVFTSDGIARASGVMANHAITLCSTNLSRENIRTIRLGAGSRVTTEKSEGDC